MYELPVLFIDTKHYSFVLEIYVCTRHPHYTLHIVCITLMCRNYTVYLFVRKRKVRTECSMGKTRAIKYLKIGKKFWIKILYYYQSNHLCMYICSYICSYICILFLITIHVAMCTIHAVIIWTSLFNDSQSIGIT